jgi:hypothetical protein
MQRHQPTANFVAAPGIWIIFTKWAGSPRFEQLCLSPQCGFSSTVEGNALSIEERMAKLRLIAETAREVWG